MTPYERLIDLFGTVVVETDQISGAEKRYKKAGKGNLAKLLGVSQPLVTHWEKRYNGEAPTDYYARIVQAAATLGISRHKVDEIYGNCTCPTCGKRFADRAPAETAEA